MGDFNTEAQRHRGDVAESRDAVGSRVPRDRDEPVGLARRASRVRLGDLITSVPGVKCGDRVLPVLSMTMHEGLMLQSDRFKKKIASSDMSAYKVVSRNQLVVSFPIDEGVLAIQDIVDEGVVSPAYAVWDVNQSRVLPEFLESFLRCPISISFYKSKLRGSTARRRTLPKDVFLSMEVPAYSLPEQRRIAAVLDQICEMKRNAETRLAKLGLLVKSRFVEMFGDPVSNPKDWQVVSLSEVVESIGNGKSFVCESHPRKNCEPAILKLSAVTWGVYKPEENKALKPGSEFFEECEVRADDLLFTRKNTFDLVGMCAYVRETPTKLMLPDLIFRLETNARIDKIFLANLINFTTFRKIIRNLASGSAASMPNISKARLLELKIPLPPLSLQRSFAAFVAEVDKLELTVRQEIEKVDLLYRAKLQEYFG